MSGVQVPHPAPLSLPNVPRLIINADDFGLTHGINRAVAELHRAHALTSATLMATGPAFADAAAIARAHPTLGVGCHVQLVDGFPISHPEDIPTLLGADGKSFRPSLAEFIFDLLRGAISENDILREAAAQIQLLQRAGIDVTHLDTHKHTHIFPTVARPLLHLAQRSNIGAIRNPFEPDWAARLAPANLIRRTELAVLNTNREAFLALPQLKHGHILTTDGTIGIAATGTLTADAITALTAHLPDGTYELITHPGYNDAALQAHPTRLKQSRDTERDALLHTIPRIPHTTERIHYGSLGRFGLLRELGKFQPNTGHEKVL